MNKSDSTFDRRAALARANRACAYCGARLEGKIYFCEKHWWAIPAPERSAIYTMHHRGLDPSTKVAKCVRILEKKLSRGKAVGPAGSSAEPAGLPSNVAAESNQAAIGNEPSSGS